MRLFPVLQLIRCAISIAACLRTHWLVGLNLCVFNQFSHNGFTLGLADIFSAVLRCHGEDYELIHVSEADNSKDV